MDSDVFEYPIHLLYEVHAEYGLAQPELLIFGENHVVDVERYLRDERCLLRLLRVDKRVGVELV